MGGGSFVGLLVTVSAIFLLVSWIGWRFFVAPPSAFPSNAPADALAVQSLGNGHSKRPEFRREFFLRLLPGAFSRTCLSFFFLLVLVGALGVASVFSLSEWIAPDPLAALEMDHQAHIQAKLNPEHLVPPPALPPSMFTGSERLALETADRDWSKLDPLFVQPVLRVLSRLAERGYSFALLEGYRSPERQEKLADMGNNVSNARAFQSKHQFGRAVDVAPINNGKLVISERDPWAMKAYEALGEEVEKAGLTWGGRWWFKDFGHVEMPGSVAAAK